MRLVDFVLLPLTGALIGWITNVLAIRLLFRPRFPLRLWPLPFTLQGVIPRRREELAANVADIVAEQLFSVDELTERLDLPRLQAEVEQTVKEAVRQWCAAKLTFLPGGLRHYFSDVLRDVAAAEVARQFPAMARSFFVQMRAQVDIRTVVREKINAFDLEEVEVLVKQVARRELAQIEWLGAVFGFLIGVFQALCLRLLGQA
ncbi:MAG TPA: DUF445 family protein [Firmicutes bacterium]|nr:DUF445 family protein [Bacillota bacterium]